MKNFYRLSQGANVVPLMAAISRKPEVWKEDTYLRDYPQGPFGEIESIILRFPLRSVFETEEALHAHEANFDQHENVDQPVYKFFPEARPLIRDLMHLVGGERLGRVMINKIKPGGRIFAHKDTPVHAEYWSRHHIVLQASPGLVFRCEDEAPEMRTGDVWWFNNSLEHEVINNGADDRVSMVVDIRTAR